MTHTTQKGFTIIEVSLFLAISSLLTILLMVGWTSMLNTQRYRDSVTSMQSFLQQQYTLVYNVENGRGDNLQCTPSTGEVRESESQSSLRGQTDCVLVGRYVQLKNGTELHSWPISAVDEDVDNIAAIKASRIQGNNILGLSEARLEIPWGATVAGGSRDVAIVVIRSPSTGVVHTYHRSIPGDSDILPTVREVVGPDGSNEALSLCLDPGTVLAGERRAVTIGAHAASQSAITAETTEACS